MKERLMGFATMAVVVLAAALTSAQAQTSSSTNQDERASSGEFIKTRQVIASVAGETIRFASLGELIQMRLEVIGSSGEVAFDSNFKSGNLIDWPVTDKQGQRLVDGSYLCFVTVTDLSGQTARKHAIVSLQDQSLSLRQSDSLLLSAAQAEAAGPIISEDVSLTIIKPEESSATAVLAHDGGTAHLVSGSGGLSISSGDVFANKLLEHMRLTAEGNLGIGVSKPQAKLDVAGLIRTSTGIVFPDGTIQHSAASKTLGAKSSRSTQKPGDGQDIQPQATGTGTQNRIAKWTDNVGTLGDSVIAELSGNIGIGTTNPGAPLEVAATGENGIRINGALVARFDLFSTNPNSGVRNWTFRPDTVVYGDFSILQSNARLGNPFGAGTSRLYIRNDGNVGIGTASPNNLLTVKGRASFGGTAAGGFEPVEVQGAGAGYSFYDRTGGASERWVLYSDRTGGAGTNTLRFWSNGDKAVITAAGNVGIGTTAPGAPLDVQVAAGQSLQFRQDSGLVPGINVKTTGGLAGIMRLRNVLEVWPSDDATRAGKVDVRNTAGSPTISLDGQTGVASFRNLPGINFSQAVDSGNIINPGLSPVDIDSLTINAPAAGYIFVSAFVYAFTPVSTHYLFDFTLSNSGAFVVNSKSQIRSADPFISDGQVPIHLSWVIPVSSAGPLQLSTVLYYDDFGRGGGPARVRNHNLTAVYLPVQY